MVEQAGWGGKYEKQRSCGWEVGRLRSRDGFGVMLPRNRTAGYLWNPFEREKLRSGS